MDTTTDTPTTDLPPAYTNAMIYGYGTASVAIISLLSLAGIALFPALSSKSWKLILQFLIGLGIGTMTADALLHIIPSVLGIHAHEDDHHTEHDHDESEDLTFVWKMSVVFGGIYAFFFFENCLKTWKRHRELNTVSPQTNPDPSPFRNSSLKENSKNDCTSFVNPPMHEGVEGGEKEVLPSKESIADLTSSQEIPQRTDAICFNFTTIFLTLFIGDALHNFADGIAIGVSFAESWPAGVGTSLAILCHEIPHEFGGFAMYLNNGASRWKAVGLNIAAALCAFAGLYIGIAVGHEEDVRSWLLAAIAGMFLYIALVQVASEMAREEAEKPVFQFVLQNLGLLIGWVIMLLIALYEDDIQTSISA